MATVDEIKAGVNEQREKNGITVDQYEQQPKANNPAVNAENSQPQNTGAEAPKNDTPVTNHANKDNTATIGDPKPDPDWGHIDDDKFKIQDGDIIEYLMKEVILESSAWCLNKVSGLAGVMVYETCKLGYDTIVKPLWGLGCSAASWAWDGAKKMPKKVWNTLTDSNATVVPPVASIGSAAPVAPTTSVPPSTANSTGDYANNPEDNFKLITQRYVGEIDRLSKLRGINHKAAGYQETKDAMQQLYRQIAKGCVEYNEDTGELISLADNKPYPNKMSKEAYTAIKQNIDAQMVALIKNELSDEEKNKYNDEQLQGFIEQARNYGVVRQKGDNPDKPDFPKLKENGNFDEVCNNLATQIGSSHNNGEGHIARMLNDMNVKTTLFAEHYAQYVMAEKYRANSDNFKDENKMKARVDDFRNIFNEGKKIFLQTETARLHGEQVPSSDKMLNTIQRMAEQSTKKAERNEKGDVTDELTPLISPYKEVEPLDLLSYAKDSEKVIALYEADIAALATEQKGIEAQQKDCQERLKACADLRSKLGLPPRQDSQSRGNNTQPQSGKNKMPITNDGSRQ